MRIAICAHAFHLGRSRVAVSIKQPHWMNAWKSKPSAYEKKVRGKPAFIERDILIRKARHAETGARIQDWLKSTGLHPPE